MKNKIILTFSIIFVSLFLVSLVLFFLILKSVSSKTGTNLLYFPKLFQQAQKSPSLLPDFNFILLGLDPRNDSLEKTETTDTIIYGNYGLNYKIILLSIPRDLWDYSINAKINQIYPLSLGKSVNFDFIQSKFSDLTGQKIDRTLIITTQNLIDLVRIVGGVDVILEKGFEDDQYPNPEYIKNPSPSVSKYITISFPEGLVHLDEKNVTGFVRSRKSADSVEAGGTDIGRINRQQLLIDALFNKLKSSRVTNNYHTLISLYNFWHSQILSNFSDLDLVSLGLKTYQNIDNLIFTKTVVPSGEDPQKDIIYHPKTFINRQWVFIPQDTEYKGFKDYIRQLINK